jgi:hypothetical protein
MFGILDSSMFVMYRWMLMLPFFLLSVHMLELAGVSLSWLERRHVRGY